MTSELSSTKGLVNYSDQNSDINDAEIDLSEEKMTKKVRGKSKIYNLVKSFIDTQEAVEFLKTFENTKWKHKEDSSNKKYKI